MWNDDQVRMLINERKSRNDYYHQLGGGNAKRAFWTEVASKINQRFRSQFTGRQASEKFQGLVRDCRVNILYTIIISSDTNDTNEYKLTFI